ncbi:molybdopterin-dependent oxidoreductase [Chitinophaga agrisoli]|uniref:Molybdopterin-dependent oxidoreductase n=1 Tax=Chitinophaga agrisoli TaxID=2607653 RepID=A0A5B2VT86_9BACT|nr:molybdopterin cofactor-binding domain-containing protein [Chitinophaga agrisoli]KAA2241359.1 molybdopterin-dependent oxidoreductase [Chitinophaga agrisoli]
MKNVDARTHLRGESVYLDDMPLLNGTLFGAAFGSPVAHGHINSLDLTDAAQMPGVVRIFTSKDITGENQIGGIIPDEPLFAEQETHFCGMPVAFVVATSTEAARAAVKKIKLDISPLPVITDPREAQAQGQLIIPPRSFRLGDTNAAWNQCTHIVTGTADTNGQEHLYIETQGAYVIPQENNALRIYSSTQGPTAVQRAVSKALGLPMHMLEVEVTRLGGGFGGKEDQANTWAALCALAAHHLKKPVKYALHRMEDMAMTGKRHPYSSDFKIGLDAEGRILAYEVTFYQNAGAAADLSPAVLERTLFHCTNSYFIPNVMATAYSCRTHLPPNTAFRGFGGPQGMFVIEAAIAKAAGVMGVPAAVIQQKNLHHTGDEFPYGQRAQSEAHACWERADDLYDAPAIRRSINAFNKTNQLYKKGMAFMPVCFGISFTKTLMNQARALVHVYTDGSVSVTTGAVEMGQGVNTKILQVAAQVFSIPPEQVRIQPTSTWRIANTSPSAASATTDLNGKATLMACTAIAERLKEVAAAGLQVNAADITLRDGYVYVQGDRTNWDWKKLLMEAYTKRVSLSEHAHYATPEIHFDAAKEKGHPFAYHVYGTAIVEVTVDCLRGTYVIDAVKVVHDFGASMNPAIDIGQIEGGIVQGIGWMTMEEVIYDADGRLRSNALSTYKVPDIYAVPKDIEIAFLETQQDNLAIFRSKAVGEPPLMYGIGAWFALRNAIYAFNPHASIPFTAPMTPEKVLMALYSKTMTGTPSPHEQTVTHLAVDK